MMLLLISLTFLLVGLDSSFELCKAKTLMFALCLFLISSAFGPLNGLMPEHLADILICPGMYKIFSSNGDNEASHKFFDAGLFFGCAILFSYSALILIPFGITALIIIRPYKPREWLLHLIGILTPIYICGAICFIKSGNIDIINNSVNGWINNKKMLTLSEPVIISACIIGVFTFAASLIMFDRISKMNIFSGKVYKLMFALFFYTVTATFCIPFFGLNTLLLALIPLTFLFVTVFHGFERVKIGNIVFILFYLGMLTANLGFIYFK